jgi:hypothetical protein
METAPNVHGARTEIFKLSARRQGRCDKLPTSVVVCVMKAPQRRLLLPAHRLSECGMRNCKQKEPDPIQHHISSKWLDFVLTPLPLAPLYRLGYR